MVIGLIIVERGNIIVLEGKEKYFKITQILIIATSIILGIAMLIVSWFFKDDYSFHIYPAFMNGLFLPFFVGVCILFTNINKLRWIQSIICLLVTILLFLFIIMGEKIADIFNISMISYLEYPGREFHTIISILGIIFSLFMYKKYVCIKK